MPRAEKAFAGLMTPLCYWRHHCFLWLQKHSHPLLLQITWTCLVPFPLHLLLSDLLCSARSCIWMINVAPFRKSDWLFLIPALWQDLQNAKEEEWFKRWYGLITCHLHIFSSSCPSGIQCKGKIKVNSSIFGWVLSCLLMFQYASNGKSLHEREKLWLKVFPNAHCFGASKVLVAAKHPLVMQTLLDKLSCFWRMWVDFS